MIYVNFDALSVRDQHLIHDHIQILAWLTMQCSLSNDAKICSLNLSTEIGIHYHKTPLKSTYRTVFSGLVMVQVLISGGHTYIWRRTIRRREKFSSSGKKSIRSSAFCRRYAAVHVSASIHALPGYWGTYIWGVCTVRIGYRVTGYNDLPGIMIGLTKFKIKTSKRHSKYHYIQCISAVVIYRI